MTKQIIYDHEKPILFGTRKTRITLEEGVYHVKSIVCSRDFTQIAVNRPTTKEEVKQIIDYENMNDLGIRSSSWCLINI